MYSCGFQVLFSVFLFFLFFAFHAKSGTATVIGIDRVICQIKAISVVIRRILKNFQMFSVSRKNDLKFAFPANKWRGQAYNRLFITQLIYHNF